MGSLPFSLGFPFWFRLRVLSGILSLGLLFKDPDSCNETLWQCLSLKSYRNKPELWSAYIQYAVRSGERSKGLSTQHFCTLSLVIRTWDFSHHRYTGETKFHFRFLLSVCQISEKYLAGFFFWFSLTGGRNQNQNLNYGQTVLTYWLGKNFPMLDLSLSIKTLALQLRNFSASQTAKLAQMVISPSHKPYRVIPGSWSPKVHAMSRSRYWLPTTCTSWRFWHIHLWSERARKAKSDGFSVLHAKWCSKLSASRQKKSERLHSKATFLDHIYSFSQLTI